MAREVVGVMTWASKLLDRVPRERLSVAGSTRGVGVVEKSVVRYATSMTRMSSAGFEDAVLVEHRG